MAGQTLKTRETDASADVFIAAVTPARRQREAEVLHEMMARVTGAPGRMWGGSIVGYGRYGHSNTSGRRAGWFLTGFSPRKQALSLYIMPGFARYDGLMARLGKHKTGKSCLYVNKLEDVDLAVLEHLVGDSVAFMKEKYGA